MQFISFCSILEIGKSTCHGFISVPLGFVGPNKPKGTIGFGMVTEATQIANKEILSELDEALWECRPHEVDH